MHIHFVSNIYIHIVTIITKDCEFGVLDEQLYHVHLIRLDSNLQEVGDFLWVLLLLPPMKLTVMI